MLPTFRLRIRRTGRGSYVAIVCVPTTGTVTAPCGSGRSSRLAVHLFFLSRRTAGGASFCVILMRFSSLLLQTLREDLVEAVLASQKLVVRAGYV